MRKIKHQIAIIFFISLIFTAKFLISNHYKFKTPPKEPIESFHPLLPQDYILSGNSININSATMPYLTVIPGIGKVTAKKIMSKRPFNEIENILKVRGIGRKKLAKIRHFIDVR